MAEILPRAVSENLNFLVAEVDQQLEALDVCLQRSAADAARKIRERGPYAETLRARIQSACVRELSEAQDAEALRWQALDSIASGLSRIVLLIGEALDRLDEIENTACLDVKLQAAMLKRVRSAVAQIPAAAEINDSEQAADIGRACHKLERDYRKLRKRYISHLSDGDAAEDLVGALFLAACLQRMGRTLTVMSDALLSGNLGMSATLERYQFLRASMADMRAGPKQLDTVAETRSGSTISSIREADDSRAIFKDGAKRKLKEERKGLRNWDELFPGLAPRLLSYRKRGKSAALLIEHLPGRTFEQILLEDDGEVLSEAADALNATLHSIWKKTGNHQPVQAAFMAQLQVRLDSVFRIHPEFAHGKSRIGSCVSPSFSTLVKQAARHEAELAAPFSVYIHGDFNVDNIIYDPEEKRINFIDLHRSRYLDYVQDVSVFMVSNYRLQIQDRALRRRILALIVDFYTRSRGYADDVGDESFDMRLALGLARSLVSSTRFILDKSLARGMFLRARYLLEQVLRAGSEGASHYRLPAQELFRA